MGYLIKVVNFHVINEINVAWFEKVILYLKKNGRIISTRELNQILKDGIKPKGKYFILTVDDGHRSFYKYIYPIIQKHKAPISLFVSPKIIMTETNFWFQEIQGYDFNLFKHLISEYINVPFHDLERYRLKSILKCLPIETISLMIENYQLENKERPKSYVNMNCTELKIVASSELVTIGAHTLNHPILANESDLDSAYEIGESILQLEDLLNQKIVDFAFPHGYPDLDYLERDVQFVKNSGIQLCYSTLFKKVHIIDNPLEIPRGEITQGKIGIGLKIDLWNDWNWIMHAKNGNQEANQRRELKSKYFR
jgi:peptidoglycan/xylan/chitin deacetylase (PgdA/CDA1 family)